MTTTVHGFHSGNAAVRVNCAFSTEAVDANSTVGATPDRHRLSDHIASAVKPKERT